jgi:hypothetical protein
MSLAYPIVDCPIGPARTALVRTLKARGFKSSGWDDVTLERGSGDHAHICVFLHRAIGKGPHIGLCSPEQAREPVWQTPMIIVNSPTAFLRYLDKHGIKP